MLMPIAVAGTASASGLLGGRVAFLDAASWLVLPALACFAAGQYAQWVWLGLASVAAAMVMMYLTLVHLVGFSADVLFGLIVYLGPWACGLTLGVALRRAAAQAALAERERGCGSSRGRRARLPSGCASPRICTIAWRTR